jgi:hypothetical protein
MTNPATGLLPKHTIGCGASLLFLVTLSGNVSAQAGDAERIPQGHVGLSDKVKTPP